MVRAKEKKVRPSRDALRSAVEPDAAPIVIATIDYEHWLKSCVDVVEPDLRLKHEEMAGSLFAFLRATFYRWASLWPEVCPDLAETPRVLAVGDLHVENFGTWRDAEGRLVWGVNDFDEVARMPYATDLTRLVTSAILAKRDNGLGIEASDAAMAVLEGYTESLEAGGNPFVLEESHPELREMALGAEREPTKFWSKLTKLPLIMPPKRVRQLLERSLPKMSDEKAWLPSAWEWAKGRPKERAYSVQLLEHAVRQRDPYYAVENGWVVRRIGPHCGRIDLTQFPKHGDERLILKAMGRETANLHLATATRRTNVLRDLTERKSDWLVEAAHAMSKATEEDWKTFRSSQLANQR
jgi:hypothetical protein